MKKIGIVCLVVLICCSLWACASKQVNEETMNEAQRSAAQLDGFKILIDPGHGDADGGTLGVNTRRPEKEVNLEIALKVRALLEEAGATVIMTRDSDAAIGGLPETAEQQAKKDADMEKRQQIIKDANADLLISIHQNNFEDNAVRGPQVFFRTDRKGGEEFAKCMQSVLNEELEIEKPRAANSGRFLVLSPGEQPGVIVECGFFSNPEEEKILQDESYQNKLSSAIVNGAKEYVAYRGMSPKSA